MRAWIGLIGLSLMASIAFLDVTIVYTALPAIQRTLAVPVIQLQWVMNIFALALATLMILSGKLGDIFGKRRVFYIGVFIFGVAAIGAGLSPSFYWLVSFRCLQGVGAAVIFTTAAALAPAGFPSNQQAHAIGIYSAITGIGLAMGPFFGGLLVGLLNWRWIFFINIPLVIVGFLLCVGNVQESVKHPDNKIDWIGVILMIIGIGSLVFGIVGVGNHGWKHPLPIIELAVGIVVLIVLWRVERCIESPLLDLNDLKDPKVLLGITICAAASVMTSGMLFLAPLYLSSVQNMPALIIGFFMLCPPVTQILIATFWSKLSQLFGVNKLIFFGIVVTIFSAIIQYFFGTSTSPIIIVIAFLLMGFIWGVANTGSITLTLQAVPPERTGSVVGLIFTNWNTTGTVLLALMSTIFTVSEIHFMNNSLLVHNITLTAKQHHTVSALLSDPARAHELLSGIVGSLATKIVPLFKNAFLYGYHNVMLFSAVFLAFALIIVMLLMRSAKKAYLLNTNSLSVHQE